MRIVRFDHDGSPQFGVVEGDILRRTRGDVFTQLQVGPEIGTIDGVKLLPPVDPSKIVAIGLNYRDHIEQDTGGMEVPDNPIIFLKPQSSIIGPDDAIILPRGTKQVEAEAELVIVIGKRCRHVKAQDASSVIFGYTCGNDVSARDYQFSDGQWVRAKGFDTFTPLGPAIETELDPSDLAITSRVDGETYQSSSTRHLLFDVPYLVEFVSGVMTLEPGDIIMTGTPAGPPHLQHGGVCEVEIEGIGTLRNPVRAEE